MKYFFYFRLACIAALMYAFNSSALAYFASSQTRVPICSPSAVTFVQTDDGNYLYDTGNYLGTYLYYNISEVFSNLSGINPIYGQNVKIANIEGGIVDASNPYVGDIGNIVYPDIADLGEITSEHASWVSIIMSGNNADYPEESNEFYMARGIAFKSELSSASIAWGYDDDGNYKIREEDLYGTYKMFFSSGASDVINSSFGSNNFASDSPIARYFDALAYSNPQTLLVISAGNFGEDDNGNAVLNSVSALSLGYNRISVGAIGFDDDLSIASFSSRGPSDFYNPITGQTIKDCRAPIDISAPGWLVTEIVQDGDSAYFSAAAGTSFAAPIVSGFVALLKSTSREFEAQGIFSESYAEVSRDMRVIKAVLMNSALKPEDWTNNQKIESSYVPKTDFFGSSNPSQFENVIVTKQGVDYNYGAGVIDGSGALLNYLGASSDNFAMSWYLDDVAINNKNLYYIGEWDAETIITATLVWMVHGEVDADSPDVNIPEVHEYAFANLTLELWVMMEGIASLVAVSDVNYDAFEHFVVSAETLGSYYLGVSFYENIYGSLDSETFALAWSAVAIPEAAETVSAFGILIFAFVIYCRRKRNC